MMFIRGPSKPLVWAALFFHQIPGQHLFNRTGKAGKVKVTLQQLAVQLVSTGRKKEARKILRDIIREDRTNETAWLLYSECLEDPVEQIEALQACLLFNPSARRAENALAIVEQNHQKAYNPWVARAAARTNDPAIKLPDFLDQQWQPDEETNLAEETRPEGPANENGRPFVPLTGSVIGTFQYGEGEEPSTQKDSQDRSFGAAISYALRPKQPPFDPNPGVDPWLHGERGKMVDDAASEASKRQSHLKPKGPDDRGRIKSLFTRPFLIAMMILLGIAILVLLGMIGYIVFQWI
jgi:hypothetical protein